MGNDLLYWIAAGGIAGWITGRLVRGGGFGLPANVAVGMLGGLVGGWMATFVILEIGGRFITTVVTAFACAVMLLLLVYPLKRD
ncbi:GlsB/YeaQ/YmgE family stress response membrane protein [Pandoraea pnomenusa]|uniref:GlsB/YeaQ/YmgE family stress response membrane protein n=1 Tax=Pandoraea pnomenusa TaxID=93220 RepID=UPI0033407E50